METFESSALTVPCDFGGGLFATLLFRPECLPHSLVRLLLVADFDGFDGSDGLLPSLSSSVIINLLVLQLLSFSY